MKKLFFIFTMLLFLTLTGVRGATAYNTLDFDIYDNYKHDLLTGSYEYDINYSTTNRIVIPLNSGDHTLYFSNINFHHILFYDAFNNYLGYSNVDTNVDLELSTYIGYEVDEVNNKILAPDKATSFALIVYNYGDTRSQTAMTYESIDDIIFNGLTYRDIFAGTNIYSTPNSPDDDILYGSGYSLGGAPDTTTKHWNGRDFNNIVQNATLGNTSLDDLWVSGGAFTISASELSLLDYIFSTDTGVKENQLLEINNITYTLVTFGNFSIQEGNNAFAISNTGILYIAFNDLSDKGITKETPTTAESFLQSNDVEFLYELNAFELRVDNFAYLKFIDIGDEPFIYNFTDIFGTTFPELTDFDEWALYYDLYKDVSGIELSYNDIFGTDNNFGGSNNLILNGDFSLGTGLASYWSGYYSDSFNNNNEGQYYEPSFGVPNRYGIYQQNVSIIEDNSYYIGFDVDIESTEDFIIRVYENTVHFDPIYWNSNQEGALSGLVVSLGTLDSLIVWRTEASILTIGDYTILDNVNIYDLTDIFSVNHEPSIEIFEDYIDVWTDPHNYDYNVYFQSASLSTITINYMYDDTPMADPDAQTTIDDSLTNIGVDSTEMKVFLAFGIMIVVAIFIGMKTQNSSFIILSEVVLVLIFTLLGWFSFWILLLMALSFVLLIIRKGLKGGE